MSLSLESNVSSLDKQPQQPVPVGNHSGAGIPACRKTFWLELPSEPTIEAGWQLTCKADLEVCPTRKKAMGRLAPALM
jgi:hypothetical protein